MQSYWSFRDEIAVIDGIAIKEKGIIIPTLLQDKIINQLYINDMGIEKNKNASIGVYILDKHKCR